MFTTLDEFENDYTIKNGDIPSEVTLNKGVMRLKREIRELKSIIDILVGNSLEPWSSSKFYEVDEYVSYNGKNYKSSVNGNTNIEPGTSSEWVLVELSSVVKGE